ncbi:hypothetical protein BURK1_02151 [Burkholderiales bacterium]|nr:hypothetical protein BURK1_02151 [Burkholderiales bacterium]
MKRPTTLRIAAFALAFALSAVTLTLAAPGGAAFVAGRIAPAAGDAFETIAARAVGKAATEVAILPGRIDVIGVRTERTADNATPGSRG